MFWKTICSVVSILSLSAASWIFIPEPVAGVNWVGGNSCAFSGSAGGYAATSSPVDAHAFEASTDGATICIWSKRTGAEGFQIATTSGSEQDSGYTIGSFSGDFYWSVYDDSGTRFKRLVSSSVAGTPLDTWVFHCVINDVGTATSTVRYYQNATEVSHSHSGSALTGSTEPNTRATYLGSSLAENLPFEGRISQVTFFNKAASSGEMTEFYNSGVQMDPTTLSFAGNLAGGYSCGNGPNDSTSLIEDQTGNTAANLVNGTWTIVADAPPTS